MNKKYTLTYTYTESGETEECGFLCKAESLRAAAEKFWNQHPYEGFKLITAEHGGMKAYWSARLGIFTTIPE